MKQMIGRWPRKLVRETLYRLGYQFFRVPITSRKAYEVVCPIADYAPWNLDERFSLLYNSISHATYVDKYRCHELWRLVGQSAKLPAGSLLEVGSWRGGTGAIIAGAALHFGLSDPVYLCDTFRGVVKAGPKDPVYRGGEHADTSREQVEGLLLDVLGRNGVRVLAGIFPEESAAGVEDDRLRFCHVHVDVYDSARDVTEWAWKRLLPGGIVVYDDFGFQGCDGVTRFIEETARQDDRMVVSSLSGHAVSIKIG